MAQRTFMSLSSGERQRAEFARGLLQLWCPVGDTAPRWLLLDEPSANLDVAHARAMLEQLRRIASRNIGVLAVLHDLDLAARCADRVILLEAGRVVVQGAPEAVMREEILSRVYRTPIHVEQHTLLNRLVVIT